MANKTYAVMKDGDVIKELKTLQAAKKLADAEEAEVFCEGLCVYAPDPDTVEDEPVLEVPAKQNPATQPAPVEEYRLTAKMNIREAPSLDGAKLGVARAGTVVKVKAVEDGWLHLVDGTFILYEGGKFAVKV